MKEALKLALEALESGVKTTADRISWTEYDCELMEQAITAIKKALAQEQEPVGYLSEGGAERLLTKKQAHEHIKNFRLFTHDVPLYTTPPQREFVGLTDDEIEQGCKESWVTEQAWQSAVWWAEAKLKEKNNV